MKKHLPEVRVSQPQLDAINPGFWKSRNLNLLLFFGFLVSEKKSKENLRTHKATNPFPAFPDFNVFQNKKRPRACCCFRICSSLWDTTGKKKIAIFLPSRQQITKIKITGVWENGRNGSIMKLLPNLSPSLPKNEGGGNYAFHSLNELFWGVANH